MTITYFLEATLCWAGFYSLYAWLLSRTTFFGANRLYLLGTLLLGAALPLMPLPQFGQGPVAGPVTAYLEPITVGVQSIGNKVRGVGRDGMNVLSLLRWIYVCGLLLFASRTAYGLWQILQLYRNGQKERRPGYTLVHTDLPHLPFSFFHLLFWSRHLALEDEDGETILRHEQAHINGGHSIDILVAETLGIVFWCSPFIYFYRRSLRNVHEYLADHVVLRTTRRKTYGHLLLRQSMSGLQIALAHHFLQSQIKQRIFMMTKKNTHRSAMFRYTLAAPLFILFLMLFANRQLIGQTLMEIHKADGTIEKHTLTDMKEADRLVSPDDIESMNVIKNEGQANKIIIRLKGAPSAQSDQDPVFTEVEVMPLFPGCDGAGSEAEKRKCSDDRLMEFIGRNMRYPETARLAKLEGIVIVSFIVGKDGRVSNPEVLREIGSGTKEEVLRVVSLMNEQAGNWTPGKQQGKAVAVKLTLPVMFKLSSKN